MGCAGAPRTGILFLVAVLWTGGGAHAVEVPVSNIERGAVAQAADAPAPGLERDALAPAGETPGGTLQRDTATQTVEVPNSDFERGRRLQVVPAGPAPARAAPAGAHSAGAVRATADSLPEDWTLVGAGRWLTDKDGGHAIAATGRGDDISYWRSAPLALEPDGVYEVSFRARSLGGAGGTPITGPVFCNVDLGGIGEEWKSYRSVFVVPHWLTEQMAWLRFGQWHWDGTVAFDDVRVRRVQPVYARVGDLVLGEGEQVSGHTYQFRAPLHSSSRSQSRPLAWLQCGFNSFRLVFGAGSEVVYRHQLGDRRQTRASFDVDVGWYSCGRLRVAVSTDGRTWRTLGTQDTLGTVTYAVPRDLLPAAQVWVRLRALSRRPLTPDSNPGSFQIHDYVYRAEFTGLPLTGQGATHFVTVDTADVRTPVHVVDLGQALPGRPDTLVVEIENPGRRNLALRGSVQVTQEGQTRSTRPPGAARRHPRNLRAAAGTTTRLALPYQFRGTGDLMMHVALSGDVTYAAHVAVHVPDLYSSSYGETLPGSTDQVGIWWADSGWKIARRRALPAARGQALRIRAARNEVEAAQLVLRPRSSLRRVRLTPGDLHGPDGARIPAASVEVLRVGYVQVTRPTDPTGAAALWPDPLLPLRGSVDLEKGVDHPFWVRVKVPRGLPAGEFRGELRVAADGYSVTVPMVVEVYGFDLPDRMTCQTAFGFSPGNVWRYQALTREQDRRVVLEKYLQDYAAHHISPYDPAPLDPIRVEWPQVPAHLPLGRALTPRIDWTAWDRAMSHALDELHFNSFRLSIPGMGGGNFHARRAPELLGYGENTAAYHALFRGYVQAVQEHLRRRGWLDEAYVYWFDEPSPQDYDFVMNGFRKLAQAGPDLTRMLTEQVEPELIGGPNLWCPVSYNFQPEAAARRQAAGDRFWWYVCTGPKAPYCTLFIDHPATELRVWLWQTWQRHIEGILIWQTNYWTSGAAYPDHPQNPYQDPMSWTSGYSTGKGTRRPWGNGDGRFVYPPPAAADVAREPVLDGPVDSIRWEMLRDGIEDYEYLAMLSRRLKRAADHLTPARAAALRELLEVPAQITSSMTRFTRDPGAILAQRDRVARAIEELEPAHPSSGAGESQ